MALRIGLQMPVYETIVPGLMPFNAFQIVPPLPRSGLIIGAHKDGPFFFDPHAWWRARLIDSPGIVIMGAKDHGKTTLAKYLVYLARTLRVNPHDPSSRLTRVWVDDFKMHEWAKLARYYGCEPFEVRKARLNPLDTRMELGDQEFIVRRILEQASSQQLSEEERSVLSSAIESMRRRAVTPSLHELAETLVNADHLQPATLHARTETRLPVPEERFRSHALDLAFRVSNMLRGPYGEVFGSDTDTTVFEALEQQMVAADYGGANEDIVRIMQMLFWIWKRAASESGSELMIDYNISDETYGLLRHVEFARPLHDTIKRLRESASTVILITHAIRDYASIDGEAGKYARSVLNDMPIWFVGKLSGDDAADIQQRFNCSDVVRQQIASLPYGTFMAFIGDLEPFPFRLMLTPKAREFTFSNQALAAKVGASVI